MWPRRSTPGIASRSLCVPYPAVTGRRKPRRRRRAGLFVVHHVLHRLFVLVADELDQIGVEDDALVDPYGEQSGVGLRVVYRDVDSQRAVVGALKALGDSRGVSQRAAPDVEPPAISQSRRLDNERIAFPPSR